MVKNQIYGWVSKGFHLLAGVSLFSVLALSLMTSPAQGQLNTGITSNINGNLGGIAGKAYNTSSKPFPEVIGSYIQVFLGLLGIVAILLVIYAGFMWMTAQGDAKKVSEAKEVMKNAVWGLVIISLAYALTTFIFNSIINAGQGT